MAETEIKSINGRTLCDNTARASIVSINQDVSDLKDAKLIPDIINTTSGLQIVYRDSSGKLWTFGSSGSGSSADLTLYQKKDLQNDTAKSLFTTDTVEGALIELGQSKLSPESTSTTSGFQAVYKDSSGKLWTSPGSGTGSGGTSGINTATIYLYRRANTAPSAPAAGQVYTFSTAQLESNPTDWSNIFPTTNTSYPLYVTMSVVASSSSTATVQTWSTPALLAKNGTNGTDGVTPIKGTDYWTPQEVTDIINDAVAGVLAALPTWTGGSF